MNKIQILVLVICGTSLLTLNGCKKDEDNNPAPTPTPTFSSTTNPEVSMKINGIAVTYKNGVGGIIAALSSSSEIGTTEIKDVPGGFLYQDIDPNTTRTWFSVDKGVLTWSTSTGLSAAQWQSFFTAGTYPYSLTSYNTSITNQSGIEVTITDANDVAWSTAFGSANQTGSAFSILQTHYYEAFGEKYIKVKFSFNCKVYDGNGASKTLTDGMGILDFNSSF